MTEVNDGVVLKLTSNHHCHQYRDVGPRQICCALGIARCLNHSRNFWTTPGREHYCTLWLELLIYITDLMTRNKMNKWYNRSSCSRTSAINCDFSAMFCQFWFIDNKKHPGAKLDNQLECFSNGGLARSSLGTVSVFSLVASY